MSAPGFDFAVRPVEGGAEYKACEALQKRVWGYADLDVVPKNELISVAFSGGSVLGAFAGERMVGFCFGFVGLEVGPPRRLYLSSRMLAVDPGWRGRGVAVALKQAQRQATLERGIDLMRWTFDPFQAANAVLNLRKLGAEAYGYVRDFYGRTTSPLHAAGTDRLLVEWRLADEPRPVASGADDLAVLVPPRETADRGAVRAAFEDAFARGYRAVGVEDRDEGGLRYRLVRS